ncbi:MAG: ABC transporter substrate-binding protein [Acidimicrobiia bacterium]|nr:ABC transporter substrate-binding protein [Acidimicrobiia bacterium]
MRRLLVAAIAVWLSVPLGAQWGGTLRLCLRSEPKTLHPLEAAEESSETIRFLTSAALIRLNRASQQPEPDLAVSWKITDAGRRIRFQLREGVRFSDGTPFTAEDVAYTFDLLSAASLRSPVADSFRSPLGVLKTTVHSALAITIDFPAPVAGLDRRFDGLSILSRRSPLKEKAVLGPFLIAQHQPGVYFHLDRNPHYWKTAPAGRRLPYLDAVRLEIQTNRDTELLRLRRGEIHLINKIEPEHFLRLKGDMPKAPYNAGPSLEPEMLWFNMVPTAPLPAHKKAWFTSRPFRNAVSGAIRRDDLVRIAFQLLATPAAGPVSPANRFWFNKDLSPRRHDPAGSLRLLAKVGFRKQGPRLVSPSGQPVEFTLITNSGNKTRARMAALIQQDLAEIGIRVHLAPLDFPSLIERITRTFDYDACLLGQTNLDLDPNSQMNVWLSSSPNHQWNPSQPAPATAWEAEIDRLMRAQAASADPAERKRHVDRVQKIVFDEEPFVYLLYKNSLAASSGALAGVQPAVMFPQVFWNIDRIHFAKGAAGN